MRNGERLWLAVLAAVSVVACGGETSSGGGSGCGTTTGCGGDVTGTWHVTSMCLQVSPGSVDTSSVPADCVSSYEAAVQSTTVQPQNYTLVMAADGTYQESGSVTFSFTWSLDSKCFTAYGGGSLSASTCASLSSSLASSTPSGTCTFVSNACRCAFTQTQTVSGTGTYRTGGTTLYTDENDPTRAASGPYCVRGMSMGFSQTTPDGPVAVELSR